MAICIVVPTTTGNWRSTPIPDGQRSAYIFYRRENPDAKNEWFLFKEYVEIRDTAEPFVMRDGHRFEIYGFEQDYGFEPVKLTDADRYRYRHIA